METHLYQSGFKDIREIIRYFISGNKINNLKNIQITAIVGLHIHIQVPTDNSDITLAISIKGLLVRLGAPRYVQRLIRVHLNKNKHHRESVKIFLFTTTERCIFCQYHAEHEINCTVIRLFHKE